MVIFPKRSEQKTQGESANPDSLGKQPLKGAIRGAGWLAYNLYVNAWMNECNKIFISYQ